ncbi:MAG: hypothetical protein AAF351_00050 [Pseudomonadota bacterium]
MSNAEFSVVTAILPDAASNRVARSLTADVGATALTWRARGTMLRDYWWARWMPPISPAKNMLQLIAHKDDVDRIQRTIIDHSRLHQQATGAVFSSPCERAFFGEGFRARPAHSNHSPMSANHDWSEDLSIICCIVGQTHSDRVARAAVTAGAHGPVIYFSEGRGLRDRIGWLRITKEQNQEVLLVLADESKADDVFAAMAKSGELDKPGRGIMYRMPVDKGMFNLHSQYSGRRNAASMQQIIHAIDQLSGHNHWRDQVALDPGSNAKGAGFANGGDGLTILENRERLTAIVPREQMQLITDIILDTGAPGINMTFARRIAPADCPSLAHAKIDDEYAVLRSILEPQAMDAVYGAVHSGASSAGVTDICLFTNSVPQIATYVPGKIDYRVPDDQEAA